MIKLNGSEVKPTIFPDKTSQIWKLPKTALEGNFANIVWEFENEAEVIHLAQLKTLLDRYNFTTCLRLPYLPYGRQDKFVSNESAFALCTFAKMLNDMGFDEVIINDPHSQVAIDLIHRSTAEHNDIRRALIETGAHVVCYPDAGALEKYTKIYDCEYVSGEKVRDQLTGNILSYKLNGKVMARSVLIVDDICDGGATFIYLAKALLDAGAKKVNLFVSHGLFTKGTKILKDAGINRIYTKNGEIHDTSN